MHVDSTIKAGTTSKIVEVMLRDSTTGQGKTGLAHGSMTASYVREGGTRVAITLAAGSAGDAYSSGKWAEVDATNQKGIYQLHIPNAALVTGVESVTFSLQATDVLDKAIVFQLIEVDLRDATDLGLTNLDATISSRNATTPPTAVQVRTEMDDNSTKLANLDAAVSSRNSTTPPTAAAIRTELDSNSTKLANLDAAVSTRQATVTFPANFASMVISAGGELTVDTVNDKTGYALVDGAITNAKFASNAITSGTLATDAIGSSQMSSGAVAKIEAALLNEGDGQQLIDAIVQAIDVADIDVLTAAVVRDAILDRVLSGNHDTAGTVGAFLQELDAAVSSRSSHTAANVATQLGVASSIDTQIAGVSTKVDENQTDLTNIETKVDTAITNVAANQTDLTNIETKVDAAIVDLAENQTDLDAVLVAISALNDFDPATDTVIVGNINTAALAKFLTTDTGETAAVAGSVGKIAQGAVGGTDVNIISIKGNTGLADKWETILDNSGSQTIAANIVSSNITASAITNGLVDTGKLIMTRGDRWVITITGLGDITGNSEAWFTIKTDEEDADSAALVLITKTAGLQIIVGATAATPSNGSLVVDDAAAGDITVVLEAVEAAKLPKLNKGAFDVQVKLSNDNVVTKRIGTARITSDVSRAV